MEQREWLQGWRASLWSQCWRQTGHEAMMSDSRSVDWVWSVGDVCSQFVVGF